MSIRGSRPRRVFQKVKGLSVVRAAGVQALRAVAPRPPKRISAMIRVKDEAEFLEASLESISKHCDQLVIIDNLSRDASPRIIESFARSNPRRVKTLSYPYEVARPGHESQQLASTSAGRRSPSLLANYYDWCVSQCDFQYILKWDGDMVATEELGEAITTFRGSDRHALWFWGVNVYPDLRHAVANSPRSVQVAPTEARVFPRRFAHHDCNLGVYESLRTPYKSAEFALRWQAPAYLHLALCKANPFHNNSSDFRWPNPWTLPKGSLLSAGLLRAVEQYHIISHCLPPDDRVEVAGESLNSQAHGQNA